MKLIQGKWGGQRRFAPKEVKFYPNFAGQGGEIYLMLTTGVEKGDPFFQLVFESMEEVRELLSQSHIVFHIWNSEEALREVKKGLGLL